MCVGMAMKGTQQHLHVCTIATVRGRGTLLGQLVLESGSFINKLLRDSV